MESKIEIVEIDKLKKLDKVISFFMLFFLSSIAIISIAAIVAGSVVDSSYYNMLLALTGLPGIAGMSSLLNTTRDKVKVYERVNNMRDSNFDLRTYVRYTYYIKRINMRQMSLGLKLVKGESKERDEEKIRTVIEKVKGSLETDKYSKKTISTVEKELRR